MASPWLPEDDLILRKSIEDGFSLETLAKGAVRFSRKFTLSELTDRWHDLLYNPMVTSSSSSLPFELQHYAQFIPQAPYHTTPVRTQYYTSRKRMRLEAPVNVDNNPIAEHVGDEELTAFRDYADFCFGIEDIDLFQQTIPDIMQYISDDQQTTSVGNVNDYDVHRMVDQLLNIDDQQIQEFCNVTDTTTTTTTEHVMHQEVFEVLLIQNPDTSFYETASHSHQQVLPDQAKTWIDPESYQYLLSMREEAHEGNRTAKLMSEFDPHPEIINGVIICTLNCEVVEIPNNDDINLKVHSLNGRNSVNSSSLKRHMKPPLPPDRGSLSQANGNGFINSNGFGDRAPRTEARSSSAFNDSLVVRETSDVAATTSSSLQHSYDTSEQTLSPEMDIDAPEENNNEIESDEDLPSFSDVEAMILDMDLEPVGQDRYELEASRYRNEEMMRMIMRLEQSAESCMKRDMASHGAFAILYGSSRHYINKAEVLLGRVTGEYPIDIDLGSSGSETKFSRRQALIKLKQDGCFEIKNLGRFLIYMNDEEIDHGQVATLKNNCLIQIRDKSFIFEMNKKAVKRYLYGNHI